MERTYTKYIPQTYRGIVNSIANETQAPRFMVEELLIQGEVEAFIDSPTNEYLEVVQIDIETQIEFLNRIKDKLENWKEIER